MKNKERFDVNEECRYLCIDKICLFFGLELESKDRIRKINNFIDTYNYFQHRGLLVEGYIDKRLLVNPKYWFYLKQTNICCNRNFFNNVIDDGIYLYYSSSKELYGIDEIWTHCVCEMYTNGNRNIYDSYFKQVKKDYKNIIFPSHKNLSKKLIIALKIRRKKDENSILWI